MQRKRDSVGMFDVLKGCQMFTIVLVHHCFFVNGGLAPFDASSLLARFTDWTTLVIGLFFVIAGYQFRPAKRLGEYIKRQFRSLILPYFVAILVSAIGRTLMLFFTTGQIRFQTMTTIIAGGLYGAIQNVELLGVWADTIQALWFLPVFFFSGLFFQLLHKISGRKKSVVIWSLTAAAVGFPDAYHVQLPWFLVQSFAVLGMMETGRYLREKKILYRRLPIWFLVIAMGAFLFCHLFSVSNIASNVYRFWMLDYLAAIMMSVVVMRGYLRFGVEDWKGAALLEYTGMYSMLFFLIHGVGLLVIPWERSFGNYIMSLGMFSVLPVPAAAVILFAGRCAGILLGCKGLELLIRRRYRKIEKRKK